MLARFFIDRPVLAWVISIVIVLLGAIAAGFLPVAEYPEITPPTVRVTANYPGANAQVVADTVAATAPPATASVYSATKAAVDAVTRSLAKELGPRNIRVNAINPGMVETEGVHAAGIAESEFRRQVEAQTPLGRIGQPRDIGPAAVFLASDESSWITGETLHIAGGHR